jgi:hypothetical protein
MFNYNTLFLPGGSYLKEAVDPREDLTLAHEEGGIHDTDIVSLLKD